MCGIFGISWRAGKLGHERAKSAALAMQRVLGHRGPDGTGLIERPGLILGHLRLAIIDIAGGAQPMSSNDGLVTLSYNGECYNFPELIDQLKAEGWSFATRSDSEVLLAGYSLRGESFDTSLNGMYAYAILDERDGRSVLQLSTDPVGIKPLFLYDDGEIIVFASELRGIATALRALSLPIQIDEAAVEAYLRLGWVPAPLALLKHTRKLLPGERWHLTSEPWEARLSSTRPLPSPIPFAGDERDLDEELLAILRKVVARQTISDVPLGFFLSGGIDSSLLLAIARELGLAPTSFTIGFKGEGHGVAGANEADVARAVASHLGLPIEVIDVDGDMLRATLRSTFDSMDQPLADPACLPLLLLSKMARAKVSVCLSGDGGDELFAGYSRHSIAGLKARWHSFPAPLRALSNGFASMLPTAPAKGLREHLRKLRVAHGLVSSDRYVDGPFAGYLSRQHRPSELWNTIGEPSSDELLQADIDGQLAGQMLPKTDNMTMAASLECRVPLLDLDLIAFARGVPLGMKMRGRSGKLPLRRLLARYVPPEISNRPKQGFRVPLTDWFRGSMADEVKDRMLQQPSEVTELLGRDVVQRIVGDHLAGRAEHSLRIWSLLCFDHWRDRTLAVTAA